MPSKQIEKKQTRMSRVRELMHNYSDIKAWVLVPIPITALLEKRDEFDEIVENAKVELVHTEWSTVGAAVRNLSDTGGVQFVNVYHMRRAIRLNATWIDGKQVKTQ